MQKTSPARLAAFVEGRKIQRKARAFVRWTSSKWGRVVQEELRQAAIRANLPRREYALVYRRDVVTVESFGDDVRIVDADSVDAANLVWSAGGEGEFVSRLKLARGIRAMRKIGVTLRPVWRTQTQSGGWHGSLPSQATLAWFGAKADAWLGQWEGREDEHGAEVRAG